MRRIGDWFRNFGRNGDLVLLFLCLVTNVFGCVIVASTTNYLGSSRSIIIQIVASVLGVMCYILLTNIDVSFFSDRRGMLLGFNVFLMLLLIPFGVDVNGNRSWIDLPLIPFRIQTAEICKTTFVIIIAKVLSIHQNRLSHFRSLVPLIFHFLLMVGMIFVLSRDAGVALIFVFIFAVMLFVGGVGTKWLLAGTGVIAAALPLFWTYFLGDYQKQRILVLFDESIDPQGLGIRWHTRQSLLSLTGGGLTGQGLFHGNRTQVGALTAQHTDYIFSAIGEELGFLGCLLTLALLVLIILRCVQVGLRTSDYCNRMICIGVAATIIFQVISNVGMCIGVMPVIGLTLPFISSGGSSIISMYMAMGIVSGIYARPTHPQQDRYIHAPLQSL